MSNWIKYAQWEQTQQEFDRARSIYERSFDVDHRCVTVWLKYAEMEMKNKQINHRRTAATWSALAKRLKSLLSCVRTAALL